jgi:SAM-dependent methyltransferase
MRLFQGFLRHYARGEAQRLARRVCGRRLLDLGAGEGWVAEALRSLTTAWICSVDVGPFRLTPGSYVVYDGVRLPFRDGSFDTTVISLALHHCQNPEEVLDEAIRVTSERLLVVESVYRSRWDRFWLNYLDGRLNGFRHGGRMNVPLAFRRAEQWRALFESRGLRVTTLEWLGSRVERLVHQPLLFVIDRMTPPAPSPTRAQPCLMV